MKLRMKIRVGMPSDMDFTDVGLGSFHCIFNWRQFAIGMLEPHSILYSKQKIEGIKDLGSAQEIVETNIAANI